MRTYLLRLKAQMFCLNQFVQQATKFTLKDSKSQFAEEHSGHPILSRECRMRSTWSKTKTLIDTDSVMTLDMDYINVNFIRLLPNLATFKRCHSVLLNVILGNNLEWMTLMQEVTSSIHTWTTENKTFEFSSTKHESCKPDYKELGKVQDMRGSKPEIKMDTIDISDSINLIPWVLTSR